MPQLDPYNSSLLSLSLNMYILFFLSIAFLWIKVFTNIIGVFSQQRKSLKTKSEHLKPLIESKNIRSSKKIFIVTPALNEQARISKYIAHLIERIEPCSNLITKIVIVCNDIEKIDQSLLPGSYTWEVAMNALSDSKCALIASQFDVIQYSGDAKRSGQLNYACKHLVQSHKMSEDDYIIFIDTDATLEDGFFSCVVRHIEYSGIDLAQAPTIYKPSTRSRYYETAAALWQNYFMLARERSRFMRRESRNRVGLALNESFWYTANGVIIKYSLISSVGGFVESCSVDDLATSCLFSTKGCHVALLDTFLTVDQVSGILPDFRQKLFWCSSYIEIFKLLDPAISNSRSGIKYILFRTLFFLSWLLRAPVILCLAFALLLNSNAIYTSLITYFAYVISSYAFPLVLIPKAKEWLRTATLAKVLCIILYPLLQSFVPWVMVVKRLICRITTDYEFKKIKV